MKKRSKNKGGGWERDLSREMSKWFTGNDDLVIWRSAGSGSVHTIGARKGKVVKETGDLRPIQGHPLPEFFDVIHVDAKSMKSVDLWIAESNQKSNVLLQEWRKTRSDSLSAGKVPLMVVHWRQKKQKFAVVDSRIWEIVKTSIPGSYCINYRLPGEVFWCVPWKDWLTRVRPESLMALR